MKQQPTWMIKRLLSALVLSAAFALPPVTMAQSDWSAADDVWDNPANWSPQSLPTSATVARFRLFPSSPQDEIHISIGSGSDKTAIARAIQVWFGKKVTLNLHAGASLTATQEFWRIGYSDQVIGSEVSALTILGPSTGTATVAAGMIQLGASTGSTPANAGGHRITFSGAGLSISDTQTDTSVIGRFGDANLLQVLDGAHLSRHRLSISHHTEGAGKRDNRLEVIGRNSRLNITTSLSIGNGNATRSNSVEISNTAAETAADHAILRTNTLEVGASGNFGGNTLTVRQGGELHVETTSAINAYASNSGDHNGANIISIKSGGAFYSGGAVSVYGTLKLADGSTFGGRDFATEQPKAISLYVYPSGRLEASGQSIDGAVTIELFNSVLAVGITPENGSRTSGETLQLHSTIKTHHSLGAELELSWFDAHQFDRINFSPESSLEGGVVRLRLQTLGASTPTAGTIWTPFTGHTSAIKAAFDLSLIDETRWDLSRFNAADGWEIVAVPEPTTVSLAGLLLLGWSLRHIVRKK